MRRATLLAALLLLVPLGAAHVPPSVFQPNGTLPWNQWTAPSGPCGDLYVGSGGRYGAVTVHGSNALSGSVDVKFAQASQLVRYDDPIIPGTCGLYGPWVAESRQHEVIDAEPSGLTALLPTTVQVTWIADGLVTQSGGMPIAGTCTFTSWLVAGGPSTTTTAPVNPTTGSCTFSLTVMPAAVKFILIGDAWVDTTALGPFSAPPYMNYLKARVFVSDAAHTDELAHCVEITPASPC